LTLPDIQLPLVIDVADLQGRDILIVPAGAAPIRVDTIDLKAHTGNDGLIVDTLAARAPLGEVRLSGRVNPTGGYPLQARLNWQLLTPDYGTFNGEGEIQGELQNRLQLTHQITGAATLEHQITGAATLELNGEVRDPLAKPAWSAKAKLDVADLKPFVPDLAGKPLTVRLDARPSFRDRAKSTPPCPNWVRQTCASPPKATRRRSSSTS